MFKSRHLAAAATLVAGSVLTMAAAVGAASASGPAAPVAKTIAAPAPASTSGYYAPHTTARKQPVSMLFGVVYGPDGHTWDNVAVTATVPGDRTPTASAITYGGGYTLLVPVGTYRIAFHDLSHRVADTALSDLVAIGPRDPEQISLGDEHLPYGPAQNLAAPVVSGSAHVGGVLATTNGTWKTSGLTYSYSWTVNGRTVAHGRSLRVTAKMAGRHVASVVTAHGQGWSANTAASAPRSVAKVRTHLKVALTRRHAGLVAIRVRVAHLQGPAAVGVVRVTQHGHVLGRARVANHAASTVRMHGLKPGRVIVTWIGPAWETKAHRTVRVRVP